MNISICKTFQCPFFSKGQKADNGSISSYGCTRFNVSNTCPVTEIKHVEANQYELWLDNQKASQNTELVISLTIANIYREQIVDRDKREITMLKLE